MVDRLLQEMKALEEEHSKCSNQLSQAKEEVSRYSRIAGDLQREFDEFATKVQGLEEKMEDEGRKVATQQIMRTRVEMMLEYQRGEWAAWDIEDTVRIYNEAYPNDAFSIDDGAEDNPTDKQNGSPKA